MFRKSDKKEFSFRRIKGEQVGSHPMRDIGKESFKARNSMMETIRGERKEKLSVISTEMVIGRMRRDEFREVWYRG